MTYRELAAAFLGEGEVESGGIPALIGGLLKYRSTVKMLEKCKSQQRWIAGPDRKQTGRPTVAVDGPPWPPEIRSSFLPSFLPFLQSGPTVHLFWQSGQISFSSIQPSIRSGQTELTCLAHFEKNNWG